MVSSAYLRLLIFLPAILIPACASSSPAFHMMYSAYKLISRVTMLMLMLSRFSRVRLCVTPQMAAHQAPPSLGFSRQEHWSGLPFPSPMHESEKWKRSRSVSVRLFVTPWTTAYQAPPSMGFCRQEYWSGVPSPSPVVCYCLVAKSCLFCDPMDYNGLPFPSPSLILEWVAISFSIINACKMAIFLILSFLLLLLAGIFL